MVVVSIVWIAFICLDQKNKIESHKKVCENTDFCNVVMPSENTKILEFSQNCKTNKTLFIIYADFKPVIEKIAGCKNNPDKSSMTKVSEHILSGFLMSTISTFKDIENKHDAFRSKDCMKMFCESLRQHAIKIIRFKIKVELTDKIIVEIK